MLDNRRGPAAKLGRWLGLVLLVVSSTLWAAAPINTLKRGFISDSDTGIAINGYDTVAYFTEHKPVKGDPSHSFTWMGAKWQFASQAHLDLFKATPEKYAPQYGGYCAYGVARGYLVTVEPEQFTVVDDKLYLNYDAAVQKKWKADPAGFNKTADAQFPLLLKK
ncbi:YHS domain-containing (seleno)protein [Hydrocarboniphaga sp.]|uniref:YHS domain-containing (seleno)protein n=1 Tax=Hydrocarboniphaga sp. TaxID=2033016 RepID=UPI003D109D3B